ncbi:MAG: hypothetical protein JHD02_00010 [Thermoleophilaceae bacterium]|nr:hypothetical protein [Thermoleophilaceae bacterium]
MYTPFLYSLTTRIDGKDGQRVFSEDREQLEKLRADALREPSAGVADVTTALTTDGSLSTVFWLDANGRLAKLEANELARRLANSSPPSLPARLIGHALELLFVVACLAAILLTGLAAVGLAVSEINITTCLALLGAALLIALASRYSSAYLLNKPSPGFFDLHR